MPFTYDAYRLMLQACKNQGYSFSGYDSWGLCDKPLILRHDLDFSLRHALPIAQIEAEEEAKSTYFILAQSDFYNPLSSESRAIIEELSRVGEIGLHFDETLYPDETDFAAAIHREARFLSEALEVPITSVSMHRPSRRTLESDLVIEGMHNAYGKLFFEKFFYASDSRRYWRKPIMDCIRSGENKRLQILTHPFWYGASDRTLKKTLTTFIDNAPFDRTCLLADNFTDLKDVIGEKRVVESSLHSLRDAVFTTDRLTLRPLRLSDTTDMFEYASNPDVCRYLAWGPYHDLSEAQTWLEKKLSHEGSNDLILGIEFESKLIGVIRLFGVGVGDASAELSYILNPAFQGCGIMTEAVREAMRICFEELSVARVYLRCDCDNQASRGIAKRMGMQEREELQKVLIKGTERNYVVYSIEKEARP